MVGYLGMILAGVVIPVQVEILASVIKYPWVWYLMCAWLALGGLCGGVGQITRRWTGEYVGLPLLVSALAGFGVLQGRLTGWEITSAPSIALLWAMALFMYARWRDVSTLYRASATRGEE